MFEDMIKAKIKYNVDAKIHFINTVDVQDTTKVAFVRILKKVATVEEFFEKNIYEFTYNEYLMLLRAFNAASTDSVYAYHFCVKKYVEFCKAYNYTHNLLGYLDTMSQEELKQYVSKSANEQMYLKNLNEFEKLTDAIINEVDLCTITLIFNGLKGKDLIEIRQLEINDVDFEKKGMYIKRNNKKVFLDMDDSVMKIVKNAISADKYIKIKDSGDFWYRSLIKSKYVIRSTVNEKMITKASLTRRIYNLKNNDWENEHISAGTIHRSGCALYAIDLFNTKNMPMAAAINNALIRYGLSQSLFYKVKEVVEYIRASN